MFGELPACVCAAGRLLQCSGPLHAGRAPGTPRSTAASRRRARPAACCGRPGSPPPSPPSCHGSQTWGAGLYSPQRKHTNLYVVISNEFKIKTFLLLNVEESISLIPQISIPKNLIIAYLTRSKNPRRLQIFFSISVSVYRSALAIYLQKC